MKNIVLVLAFFTFCGTSYSQKKKILFVSTNTDSVGANKSGTYLKEIAIPFKYFSDKGYVIDIVTPKGGNVSLYEAKSPDSLIAIRDSKLFINKTNNSLSPAEVNARDYVAVFYPGGHGQYFDVLFDERIAKITAVIHENGGVLGAAGHGMSSWINIRLSNCEFLVKGKTITCFPTWAEKAWMNISGFGKLLPFDMEEVFTRRGAKLIVPGNQITNDKSTTNITDLPNRIVTGSFAFNAQWVAEEMERLIKAGRY